MTTAWKIYQDTTASFFRKLGFDAQIEAKVEGARVKHKIAVFVTGSVHGISFRWVVECKHWKTNIPKEKVLALISIVQDVGSDRGFLLSETGFQSGAIRASRNTNITLSSLDDLKLEARTTLTRDEVSKLRLRQIEINKRLWKLHKSTGDYFSDFMKPMGEIAFLDLALDDGLEGKFPVVYTVTRNGDRPTAANWDELIQKLTELIDSAEAFAEEHKHKQYTGA